MSVPREESRAADVLVLGLCAAVLAGGAILESDGETVLLRGRPLPRVCLWRGAALGECPGCGLARSVVAFCHLRWQDSWKLHPGGCLIVIVAVVQVTYRLVRLLKRCGRNSAIRIAALSRGLLCAALLLALSRWTLHFFSGTVRG